MLQIVISNNIRIRGASTPLRLAIMDKLTMDNPEYKNRIYKKLPTWGIDQKLKLYVQEFGDLVAPRGFEQELIEILKLQGITPETVIQRQQTEVINANFGKWDPNIMLRDYQKPFVNALLEHNGTGVAPAGSGKTIMALNYVFLKKQPALWLTHTKDLMYQTKARAEMCLQGVGRIGLIGDDMENWGDGKLIIATVQTLHARPKLIDVLNSIIGTVVIDEAHHFPADMFIEVGSRFTAKNFIAVTATPERKDEMERLLYVGVGPIQYEVKRDALYSDGALIKPIIKFIYTNFNYDPASISEGTNVDAGGEKLDYNDLMYHLIRDPERLKLVVENIVDNAYLGYSLVLTESVRYSFMLKEAVARRAKEKYQIILKQAVVHGGIQRYSWRVAPNEAAAKTMAEIHKSEYRYHNKHWEYKHEQYTEKEFSDWQVTGSQRKEIMAAMGNKDIDILYATQLAREGLDFAHLNVLHMATPKRGDKGSRRDGSSVEQETGRIQRPDKDHLEKRAYLFDYVDYNVEVFRSQYSSRRTVYKRLGLNVPKKQKTEADIIEEFLSSNMPF